MIDKTAQGPLSDPIARGLCPTCGDEVDEADLRSEASRREATLTGMCQGCQDDFFGQEKTAAEGNLPTSDNLCPSCYSPAVDWEGTPEDRKYHCKDCGEWFDTPYKGGRRTWKSSVEKTAAEGLYSLKGTWVHPKNGCDMEGTGQTILAFPDRPANPQPCSSCGVAYEQEEEKTSKVAHHGPLGHDCFDCGDWEPVKKLCNDCGAGQCWMHTGEGPDGEECGYCGSPDLSDRDEVEDLGDWSTSHGWGPKDDGTWGPNERSASKEIPSWIREAALGFEVDSSTACDDCGSHSDVSPWTTSLKICGACRAAYEVSG